MGMQKMGRPVITTRRKSKNQLIAEAKVQRANADLEAETNKQIDIVWHALAIALHRYHGFTNVMINELVAHVSTALWEECAGYAMISMIEMLWDECGIELMNEDKSQHWYEVKYLNSDIAEVRDYELNEWLAMRRGQKSWVGAQITACALLSLYRMENWKDKAMEKLFLEFESVKAEFNYDPQALRKACDDETDWMISEDYLVKE